MTEPVLEMTGTLPPVDPSDEVRITAEAFMKREANKPIINQYLRGDLVGKGQHGEVFKCYDLTKDKTVCAMKVVSRKNPRQEKLNKLRRKNIPPSGSHLPVTDNMGSTYQKILQEIAIMKRCRHPHIVRLLEVIDDKLYKKIYMIMEFLGGGEIKWRDPTGNPLLSVSQSRRIIRDVVLGLEYLHHQGIIHRDIKPANLMWTSDRRTVKITDFGVAHSSWAQRLAESGEEGAKHDSTDNLFDDSELCRTAGTPSFLAPEVVWIGNTTGDVGSSSIQSSSSQTEVQSSVNGNGYGHGHGPLSHLSNGSIVHIGHPRSSASTFHVPSAQSRRPPITKAIDVWALGVTLYCLLFGEVPFLADNEWVLYQVITKDDWTVKETMGIAPGVPTGGRLPERDPNGRLTEAGVVISFLEQLMEKDVSRRITLDEVKRHDWFLSDIVDPLQWVEETTQEKSKIVTAINEDAINKAMTPVRFQWAKGITRRVTNIFRVGRSRQPSRSFVADRDQSDNVGVHSAPTVSMGRHNKNKETSIRHTNPDPSTSRHHPASTAAKSTSALLASSSSRHLHRTSSWRRSNRHRNQFHAHHPPTSPVPINVSASRSKSMDRPTVSPGMSPSGASAFHYPAGTTKSRRGSASLLPLPYSQGHGQQQTSSRSFIPTPSHGADENNEKRLKSKRFSLSSFNSFRNLCKPFISTAGSSHDAHASTSTSPASTNTPTPLGSKHPSRQNSSGQTSSGMTSPYEGPTTRSSEEVSPTSPSGRFGWGHFPRVSNPIRASSWGDVGDYATRQVEEVQSVHSGEKDDAIDEEMMLFGAGGVGNGPLPPTPNGSILMAVPPVPHLSALSAVCSPDSGSASAPVSTTSTLKAVPTELLHPVMGRDPATEADPALRDPSVYSRPGSSRPHAPSPLVQLSYSSEELDDPDADCDPDLDDDSSFFERESEGAPLSAGSRMYDDDDDDDDSYESDGEEAAPLEVRRRRPSWSVTEADLPPEDEGGDDEDIGHPA